MLRPEEFVFGVCYFVRREIEVPLHGDFMLTFVGTTPRFFPGGSHDERLWFEEDQLLAEARCFDRFGGGHVCRRDRCLLALQLHFDTLTVSGLWRHGLACARVTFGLHFDSVRFGGQSEATAGQSLLLAVDIEDGICRIPGDEDRSVLRLELDIEITLLFRFQ